MREQSNLTGASRKKGNSFRYSHEAQARQKCRAGRRQKNAPRRPCAGGGAKGASVQRPALRTAFRITEPRASRAAVQKQTAAHLMPALSIQGPRSLLRRVPGVCLLLQRLQEATDPSSLRVCLPCFAERYFKKLFRARVYR